MAYELKESLLELCTSCWNDPFDNGCPNCNPKSKGSIQFSEILSVTLYNTASLADQIERIKNEYIRKVGT